MAELKDFLKRFNKVNRLSSDVMFSVKKRYLSLYRAYMMCMYDEGFISDPTCFNEVEIRKNIQDMKITGMVQSSGVVCLSSKQVGFALCKNKSNEDAVVFLRLLEKVLYYRECNHDIDILYDTVFNGPKESNKDGSYSVGMSLRASGPFIQPTKPYRVCEGVLACLYKDNVQGKRIRYLDFNDKIYDLALRELNIHYTGSCGLFVKGLSREEEISHLDLILDGLVTLNGKKSKELESWLKAHARNVDVDEKYRNIKIGLYSYILQNYTSEVFSYQKETLKNCIDKVGEDNILSMSTTKVYFCEPEERMEFPVSHFVVFAGEEDLISTDGRNVLEGYTGECYEVSYLEREDAIFTGCPIELYMGDEVKLVVDLEQTEYYKPKGSMTWFTYREANLSYDHSLYLKGKYEEGSFEDELFRAYGDIEKGTVLSEVRSCKTEDDITRFEKAKERVFKDFINSKVLKSRKEAISRLYDGDEKGGSLMLKKEFSTLQVGVLLEGIRRKVDFEKVWSAADPLNSCDKIKKELRG